MPSLSHNRRKRFVDVNGRAISKCFDKYRRNERIEKDDDDDEEEADDKNDDNDDEKTDALNSNVETQSWCCSLILTLRLRASTRKDNILGFLTFSGKKQITNKVKKKGFTMELM